MPRPIACPSCQRRLLLPEDHQEQLLQCPGCGNRFRQQDGIPYLEPALDEQPPAPPYREPGGEAERSERVQNRANLRPERSDAEEPLPAPPRKPRQVKRPRSNV